MSKCWVLSSDCHGWGWGHFKASQVQGKPELDPIPGLDKFINHIFKPGHFLAPSVVPHSGTSRNISSYLFSLASSSSEHARSRLGLGGSFRQLTQCWQGPTFSSSLLNWHLDPETKQSNRETKNYYGKSTNFLYGGISDPKYL